MAPLFQPLGPSPPPLCPLTPHPLAPPPQTSFPARWHAPQEHLKRILQAARDAGIRNILALRGEWQLQHGQSEAGQQMLREGIAILRAARGDDDRYTRMAVQALARAEK